MRLHFRTRFSAALLALVVLALLSGGVAQYTTRHLGRLMHQAVQENHPRLLAATELEKKLDDRIEWATWLVGGSMMLMAVLGALLIWLFFHGVLLPLRQIVADARGFSGDDGIAGEAQPDELRTVGVCLRALMSEVADTRSRLELSRTQLFQAERLALAGKLAASLAHEIRSPLTAIKMWIFAIRAAVAPSAELNRKFDIVAEEMARLERMLRNFLEFPGPTAPLLRPQCISTVIDKTFELTRHQIRQKRIRFVNNEPADLPQVLADPQHLEQVFLNLLNNAVEATAEGGEIRFLTATERQQGDGDCIVVRVQDTGPGIPDETRARIFDPFYTTKEGGTGLGLYIAAQIMAQLGGRLVLECSRPGHTSFAVWIPTVKMEDHEQNSRCG
jgi:signal transduction histidine kinase